MKKVMLACGSGASSGFMAGNARKAASEQNIDIEFFARSDSEIEDYIDEIHLVLIGPHLSYIEEDIKEVAEPYNVPVKIIPQEIYGKMDGPGLVEFAQEHLL